MATNFLAPQLYGLGHLDHTIIVEKSFCLYGSTVHVFLYVFSNQWLRSQVLIIKMGKHTYMLLFTLSSAVPPDASLAFLNSSPK